MTMGKQNIDDMDLRILSMLRANARVPFLEIARATGLSGAAIHQRIQKLQASEVIQGFETRIDPAALGYDACAIIGVVVADRAKIHETVERLRAIPQVTECHFTTGQYDMVIRLYARNNKHLFDMLVELQKIGFGRTETLVSFQEVFSRTLPVDAPENTDNHG